MKIKRERNLRYVNGQWICEITLGGKRVRRFVGYTKEQARNALAKMRIDKLDERLGFKNPGNGEAVPFKVFAESIIETSKKQGKRSWQRDEFSLAHLDEFFKEKTLGDIGPERVEEYKSKRRGEVSPATVNLELAFLKSIFNKAVRFGKIGKNPISDVEKFKLNNARERILDAAEARRLVKCANPTLRPILVVALNTGMRRNEILTLRWPDINFSKGFILIEDSKSGKSRKVPMNRLVREILRDRPKHSGSDFVFSNPETKTRLKDVNGAFTTARTKAEIKGLRLHDLRHTFATWWIATGGDLVALSKILGHSTIQMTMRYAHPTPEIMRMGVERVGEYLEPGRRKDANGVEVVIDAPRATDYTAYN